MLKLKKQDIFVSLCNSDNVTDLYRIKPLRDHRVTEEDQGTNRMCK